MLLQYNDLINLEGLLLGICTGAHSAHHISHRRTVACTPGTRLYNVHSTSYAVHDLFGLELSRVVPLLSRSSRGWKLSPRHLGLLFVVGLGGQGFVGTDFNTHRYMLRSLRRTVIFLKGWTVSLVISLVTAMVVARRGS